MNRIGIVYYCSAFVLSPLLLGIVNRTKAFFAGRRGPPLLQMYYDIAKLLRKGAVYSRTTTWIFKAGPALAVTAPLVALMLIPCAGQPALISFEGDMVLFIYLLGLMRFFTVLAALDTGSSFEGMGASREVQFALLAEPALFLGLAALARETQTLSLSRMYSGLSPYLWTAAGPILALVVVSLLVVFLAENSRIPVDDPNTHLELTMIHEVMALDHSGVDFAYILSGACLKFWLLGTLIIGVVLPFRTGDWRADGIVFFAGLIVLAVVVGSIESVLCRVRLVKVPHLLVGAFSLSVLAFIFQLR